MTSQVSAIKATAIDTLETLGYPYRELAPKTIQFQTFNGRIFRASLDLFPYIFTPVNYQLHSVRSLRDTAVLVNEANKRTQFGFFELSDDDGLIFYHLGTTAYGHEFATKTFFEMISAAEIELPLFENAIKTYLTGNFDLSQALMCFDEKGLKELSSAYNESNPANSAKVYRTVESYAESKRYRISLSDQGGYRIAFMIHEGTRDRLYIEAKMLDSAQILQISARYVFDEYTPSAFTKMQIAAGCSNYPGRLGCYVFDGGKYPKLYYKAAFLVDADGYEGPISFEQSAMDPIMDFITRETELFRGKINMVADGTLSVDDYVSWARKQYLQ